MTSTTRLADLSLAAFSERLAQRTPTPGGGSVAAYLAALGAALSAMAFRFTSGEKYAEVERAMAERVEGLERMRARALALVDEDKDAYDVVTSAYKMPKGTETEKAARSKAIQAGLRGALEVPCETMKTALAALELAASGAADINPNLASDCASGAWCLSSAIEGALMNVRINAASLDDTEFTRSRLALCTGWQAQAGALAESIRVAVDAKLA